MSRGVTEAQEAAQFELNSALEFGDYARAERMQTIVDALRLTAALAESWQPMETAPIDGTVIDLWAKRKGTLDKYERVSDCFWGDIVDWWGHERQDWIGLYQHQYRSYESPTHWRPLPAAPHQSGEGGK